jgi:hypothetical protein
MLKYSDCAHTAQARDYLLYFYYGGMVYAAVQNYGKAIDMFQLAFTMPSQGTLYFVKLVENAFNHFKGK